MSQTALTHSHRKLRRAARVPLLRTGVAGGVLSTLAVTAAAAPSSATEEQAAGTAEMSALASATTTGAQQAAEATQAIAERYRVEAARIQAAEKAMDRAARRAEAKAEAAAEAERRAEEASAARAARADRATRDAQRTTLSAPSSPSAPVGGGNVSTLVSFLRAQVGKAYVLGATGPNAYDCSSLTQAAFRQIGVSLPRTSQPQSTTGTPVSLDSLRPGDILHWGSAGSAYHVAVYIGGGRYIGAQNPSTGVAEHDLSYDTPTGAVRVL